MKLSFGNVDLKSSSGPNSFGKKLANTLILKGVDVVPYFDEYDVLLAFIEWPFHVRPGAKLIQRLDGIWFNSSMNWEAANRAIMSLYEKADGVIFQSRFNERLTEKFFGKPSGKSCVINNGTNSIVFNSKNMSEPMALRKMVLTSGGRIFICASNWRPHKRLNDCINFFKRVANDNDRLLVVGKPDHMKVISDKRIVWLGYLEQELYKNYCFVSDYMIHLAWLDHCPNVVVEALMSSCPVICTDSGGTKEIVRENGIILPDSEWDFKPHNLYDPPSLDLDWCAKIFNENCKVKKFDRVGDLHISVVADRYIDFINKVLGGENEG